MDSLRNSIIFFKKMILYVYENWVIIYFYLTNKLLSVKAMLCMVAGSELSRTKRQQPSNMPSITGNQQEGRDIKT